MTTEIKFEEHQTLEQVQKNFQSSYIENDIVFWEINDQMPFEVNDYGLISYALDERFNSEKTAWDFIKSSTYVDGFVEELKYQHIEVA
jgi:hypothetical protein